MAVKQVTSEGEAIVVALDRCLACRGCEMACALVHCEAEDMEDALLRELPLAPRVKVIMAAGRAAPIQCRHCEDAPCVEACASGAFYREEKTGRVLIETEKCIGCRSCIDACPFGAVEWNSSLDRLIKCDMCDGIVTEGEPPACVAACLTGARSVGKIAELAAERRRAADAGAETAEFEIEAEGCICCGRCAKECPTDCISGKAGKAPQKASEEDKKKGKVGEPFVINKEECVKCGSCYEVCPTGAVKKLDANS